MHDFGEFEPTRERRQYLEALRREEDEYFDDLAGRWDSSPVYLPDEANDMAQSLHRYRLVTFSNFLTTPRYSASPLNLTWSRCYTMLTRGRW